MAFDIERTAFYCKQCRTMVEGGILNMPEGIMVSCHGETEILGDRWQQTPATATKDDPHVVTVFKSKPETGPWKPKRPNMRFYCKPDEKMIAHFQYQRDTSSAAERSGRVHVFVVKCTGDKCGNREHIRAYSEQSLDDNQLFGGGPPLVLDLNTSAPIPHRKAMAKIRGHDPENQPASTRLPGVNDDLDAQGNLPPRRLITLEEDN